MDRDLELLDKNYLATVASRRKLESQRAWIQAWTMAIAWLVALAGFFGLAWWHALAGVVS